MDLPKPGERVPGKFVTDLVGKEQEIVTKVAPWTESAFLGSGSIKQQKKNPRVWSAPANEQALVQQLHQGLPDPVRRSARDRYETLVLRLTETARVTKMTYGYVRWPASIQTVLDSLGVKATASEKEQVYALPADDQDDRRHEERTCHRWRPSRKTPHMSKSNVSWGCQAALP